MTYALEVIDIKKDFILPMSRRRVRAVDGINFKVEEGHVVGFLGANGAGKTTTLKTIMRLIFPDSGTINIFGEDHRRIHLKEKIGFLTERPYFYDYLTGREFLVFCAKLFKDPDCLKRIDPLLEEVGLTQAADRPLRRYSKGMLQRVGIAQALVNNPKLIILDEPMSGLDPDGRAEMAVIIENCHKRGATVLFSTHLLNDVENICDRVIMVDKGKMILEESVSTLLARHTTGILVESRSKKSDFRDLDKKTFATEDESQKYLIEILKAGDKVMKVLPSRPSLEDIFLKVKRRSS